MELNYNVEIPKSKAERKYGAIVKEFCESGKDVARITLDTINENITSIASGFRYAINNSNADCRCFVREGELYLVKSK